MLEFTLGIILGIIIGGIVTTITHKAELVGTLHIVHTEHDDLGLYVELKDEVQHLRSKRYATMKIREINTDYNEKQ